MLMALDVRAAHNPANDDPGEKCEPGGLERKGDHP